MKWWDFLCYASFGLVVTSFVQIVGVLLLFTYLIVPSVCAILAAKGCGRRLVIGVLLSFVGGVSGLILSYYLDLPSGAAIVCVFGLMLVISGGVAKVALKAVPTH